MKWLFARAALPDAIWVLVSGALQVRKGDVLVNMITQPGALVGEISLLLDVAFGATVEAARAERHAPFGRRSRTSG